MQELIQIYKEVNMPLRRSITDETTDEKVLNKPLNIAMDIITEEYMKECVDEYSAINTLEKADYLDDSDIDINHLRYKLLNDIILRFDIVLKVGREENK